MIRGVYAFAGIRVGIRSIHSQVHCLCRDYAAQGEPELEITVTPEDIRREAALPEAGTEEGYLETLAVYRKIAEGLLDFGVVLFHGSAIALDGQGYLFTAKSGTGKSTHTRLWRQVFGDRVLTVNDDKPLLKITPEGTFVCGTPWDGKHRLSTNTAVPLRGLCILRRGTENEIHPISPREALPRLLEQCYRPAEPGKLLRTLELLDDLAKTVKFYSLSCNMDPEAAEIASRGMGCSEMP